MQATTPTNVKKKLYLSLVVPVVTYGSPVWRPSLIRDIVSLEKLQRRATKYMLHDYQLDYKSRLCQLKLLPLMYQLEFVEVISFITQLNCRSSSFDIPNCFSFSSSTTRCGSHKKLIHSSKSRLLHVIPFSIVFQDSGTLCLPLIYHPQSPLSNSLLNQFLLTSFMMFLILMIHTHITHCLSLFYVFMSFYSYFLSL